MGIKTRVIPVLLWDDRGAVKGRQFRPERCIGSMIDRIRLIERRDVDELIILDIAATPNNRGPRFDEVAALCNNLFCPVTIGGGIKSCSDIKMLLASGADKIALNSSAVLTPSLVSDAAMKFGSQAVVVSIDAMSCGRARIGCGSIDAGFTAKELAFDAERRGAGEILLTAIDRDGTMQGYDLELVNEVANAVDIPVIAAGGAGTYEHMRQAIEAGAHAVASGAMFQFCEATPRGAARYLNDHGIPARL